MQGMSGIASFLLLLLTSAAHSQNSAVTASIRRFPYGIGMESLIQEVRLTADGQPQQHEG